MGNFLYKQYSYKEDLQKEPDRLVDTVKQEGPAQNKKENNIFSLTRETMEGKNVLIVGKKGRGKSTLILDIISKLPFKRGHIIHSDESFNPVYQHNKVHKKFTNELMACLLYDRVRYSKDFKYFVIDTDQKNKSKSFRDTLSELMKDQHYTILMTVDRMTQPLLDKFDLIFMFKDSNAAYIQPIWEDWQRTSPTVGHSLAGRTQETFRDKIKHLEDDHTCLVIDRTSREMSLWPSLGSSWEMCHIGT